MSLTMKKISLIIIFIFVTLILKAQSGSPYKPFESFNNDTLAFLEYNFDTRSNFYKGKTVEYIVKDLGLQIKSYEKISTMQGICALALSVHHNGPDGEFSELFDYYIIVDFLQPISGETKSKLHKLGEPKWTLNHYSIVQKMTVKSVRSNPYIKIKRARDSSAR